MSGTLKLTGTYADGLRRLYSNGKDLQVEVSTLSHHRGTGSLMSLWVKKGLMPEFVERTLHVAVYLTLEDGSCVERFNPTAKRGGFGYVLDFDWVLEATPENEDKMLREIERRYDAGLRS